ncbi:SDR family oxidoreductase [Aquicoccus porphyridii]|uniref:SDR family oxidoreductase n=1 Tax=Aquicoccus porphyridii TaxID=1852029 RepID=A0A5A9Z6R0_9RHOB|nr:SDR family NAD(P)-dependent oxidoreductase [Aquicoccus porphyridii]KAA0912877.1 SDR family oxidoreductase [Aquicoccus porphyridii]RAI54382.1 3-oxoacyl-ACP reductase [Rhodobacteraceae bacterium AsT-22]
MTRLAGKRAAVIGAGSVGPGWGNGKAMAVRFAREGARVLCVDRNLEAAQETAGLIADEGGVAEVLAVDVTAPEAGDAVSGAMERAWGGVDVLAYNVGISQTGGVLETSDADWARVFDINLGAAMRITRAVLPGMRSQGTGAFVYVSSLAAVYSAPYSYVSYEVSKAGLVRFARSVAHENAPHGVRSNVILPGVIETPHVNAFVDSETNPEDLARRRAAMVPMGRQGSAWDVANAALYLASDEAGFVTGVELRVDGGLTA